MQIPTIPVQTYSSLHASLLQLIPSYNRWDATLELIRRDPDLHNLHAASGGEPVAVDRKTGKIQMNRSLARRVLRALDLGWVAAMQTVPPVRTTVDVERRPDSATDPVERSTAMDPVESPPELEPPTQEELRRMVQQIEAAVLEKQRMVYAFLIAFRTHNAGPNATEATRQRQLELLRAIAAIDFSFRLTTMAV
jgi:hypothetical protein